MPFLNDQPLCQLEQRVWRGDSFDLDPVFALMGVTRVQQSFIQRGLVAEQEQSFGVGIEPADGIDVFREAEFGKRPIGRPVRREPREDAVGFVVRDEHDVSLRP
jgi:hypothetical protein